MRGEACRPFCFNHLQLSETKKTLLTGQQGKVQGYVCEGLTHNPSIETDIIFTLRLIKWIN